MTETASPVVDTLLAYGLPAAVAVTQEARRKVLSLIPRGLAPDLFLHYARRTLARHEPLLARTLTDALLAAWLGGAWQVVSDLPDLNLADVPPVEVYPGIILPAHLAPPPDPPPPRFLGLSGPDEPEPVVHFPLIEEAARDLAARRVMTREDFDRLEDDARRQAFTVARVGSLDALAKIRDAAAEDARTGGTLRAFRRKVGEALDGSALSPAHVENVYRTNIGQAQKDAQQEILSHPLVQDEFPYVAAEGIHDARRRAEHRWFDTGGLQRTNIFRADDPVIRKFWFPWGYNCRCGMVPLSLEDAAARGITEARYWLESGQPPLFPAWVQAPPFDLPRGWERHGRFELPY